MLKVGIWGYGNLGRGVELALCAAPDLRPAAIFTRRPDQIKPLSDGLLVLHPSALYKMAPQLDVVILCGSSAKDLPNQTPMCAALTPFVDSFDIHDKIPAHYERVDRAACLSGTVGIICAGWDPGLFSIARAIGQAIFPNGQSSTFWGQGVSQGHSAALRSIEGVQDARQYTIPLPDALENARAGHGAALSAPQCHRRVCYIVPKPGADTRRIERDILQMPGYFAGYPTEVHFITERELAECHAALPHGGHVICTSRTGRNHQHNHMAELTLQLDSNPEFTGAVLVAYARAAVRLHARGERGCRTPMDIPPALLAPVENAQLRASLL